VCPAASLNLLLALAARSLIVVEERSGQSEPRYWMLETIREFAAARLADAGEVELLRTATATITATWRRGPSRA
jgi:predicted ATPase